MSLRRHRCRRGRGERGAALVFALLFLTMSAVTAAGLLKYTNTSSRATSVLRSARGTDFDVDSAMQAAIATIRVGTTQGYVGSCSSYTPSWTLNNTSVPLRVDCYPFAAPTNERHVVLSVCPSSAASPCSDTNSMLRADVFFYDDQSFGRAVSIQSWGDQ